ncbi:c-type cytochrome domain-containing protein [Persicitalea sp.]|uniref:c-type cytochrome domain-containing protein n=1 Tax=Persicitalea sp. TaxID=3100273 RepID=UPI003594066A
MNDRIKIRVVAENLLLGLTVTIAFLLIFESKLVVPVWLQSVGRLHPMLLHFPLVLLMVAVLLEFFRFSPANAENAFYQNFSRNFLLSGALLAAVTVVMGLFLAQEEGYSGDTLFWHKWTGAGIFFLSAGLYFVRNASWYKVPVARAGGGVLLLALVLGGHFGASLTHGDDYVLAPFKSDEETAPVPFDEALVFADVIQPIFNQKCIGCHNADKKKGGLLLTSAEAMMLGGKNGEFFVAGQPEISLLLQRIHLPMDEKKHMPPSGKTQLADVEMQLLALWVQQHKDFKQKVADLPVGDSLRLLAAARLQPVASATEIFTFAAPDEEQVEELNSDYRTVSFLARQSPALVVNIYNKNQYAAQKLEELRPVRMQIVSLNLSKMPVEDEELAIVATFENLRKLNLNFTDISAQGLHALAAMPHLKTLTLSGTKLDFNDLQTQLGSFKALESVSVWDAGLSGKQIAQLKKARPDIDIIGGFVDDGESPLKLNPPQEGNATTIFEKDIALRLQHPIRGTTIRFTTDGSEPDSVSSPVFKGNIILKEPATIKAKAFKAGWLGSETATFDFFKCSHKPDSLRLLYPLNRVHLAEGAETFFNKKLGAIGANNPAWANFWAGVRDNDLGLVATFKQPVTISSVGLHYMIEEDTGIFPPEWVEIWGGESEVDAKLLAKVKPKQPQKGDFESLQSIAGTFKPQSVSYLKIVARPVAEIPEHNTRKGKKALLLVDEMFIN